MNMTVDPNLIKIIEKTVEQKIEKQIETVQIAVLRKEFLTREEFLEAMNHMDKRFESMQKQMNERFEAMDKRFEAMDKRFEAMDKRFEAMLKQMNERFEAMQKQMNERFEAADKRFETLINEVSKGFEEARKDRMELRAFLSTVSSSRGIQLEKAVLELLKDKLIQEAIPVRAIKKEYLYDKEGKFFYENYSTDIDVVIQDGKTVLIEVKSGADNRDVNDLLKKAALFKVQFNKNYDLLMLFCLEINQRNLEDAIRQGIRVIAGQIV